MRPILPSLVIAAAILGPFAARAESGMCEYRHPAHPGWDFFAACDWSETVDGSTVTKTVTVSNGSKLTASDDGIEARVNGRAATRLERSDAECWRTSGESEVICLYPAGSPVPEGFAAPTEPAPASATTGLSLGGGQAGFCLVELGTGASARVAAQGPCTKREVCAQDAGGATGCIADYVWKDGRETATARGADWTTLQGAEARADVQGCIVDDGAGLRFCFSTRAFAQAEFPSLAAPVLTDAEIATLAPQGVLPAETPLTAPDGTCRFTADGSEISSYPCKALPACTPSGCTLTLFFDGRDPVEAGFVGDASGGMITTMNGAKTDEAFWSPGAPVCISVKGATAALCYEPAAQSPGAE